MSIDRGCGAWELGFSGIGEFSSIREADCADSERCWGGVG